LGECNASLHRLDDSISYKYNRFIGNELTNKKERQKEVKRQWLRSEYGKKVTLIYEISPESRPQVTPSKNRPADGETPVGLLITLTMNQIHGRAVTQQSYPSP